MAHSRYESLLARNTYRRRYPHIPLLCSSMAPRRVLKIKKKEQASDTPGSASRGPTSSRHVFRLGTLLYIQYCFSSLRSHWGGATHHDYLLPENIPKGRSFRFDVNYTSSRDVEVW